MAIGVPQAAEQVQDPRALAEGRQAAQQLPREHLAEVCQVQKQEAEDATKSLRADWQEYWDLWAGDISYEGKEEWQSQIWVQKPFAAVEQAGSVIRRSLIDSPDFYGVDGIEQNPTSKVLAAHVVRPMLDLLLGNAGFTDKFADTARVGFMLGVAGYLKFRWNVANVPKFMSATIDPETGFIVPAFSQQKRATLAIDFIEPWKIRRDPDSKPREPYSGTYLWHSEWKDRPALRAMVGGGWDPEAVQRVLDSGAGSAKGVGATTGQGQEEEARRKQQQWTRHRFRKSYLVDEGWFDVIDENGDVVFPNALMVHANNEILYGPVDNPIWATDLQTGRRKWPFLAASPIEHPTRFEGRGILEQDLPLSLLFNNMLNLTVDALNWVVNPGTEVFTQGLVDWDDTADYPGKMWEKTIKEAVMMPAQRGKISLPDVLAFLNFSNQERQNVNFVNDFVIGLPGSRADITKGEVQIKTGQSMAVFEAMGKNMERLGRHCIELAFDLWMQYMGGSDFVNPSVSSILGPHRAMLLATMPIAERINLLQGNFTFKFTGVSQALQKADQLANMMKFAALAASGPYAGRTNYTQILRVLAQLFGVDDRIDVYDPAPVMPMPGQVQQQPGQGQAPAAAMRAVGTGGGPAAMEPAVG